MAEHVRHDLARRGFPVQPSRVGTLTQFLDRLRSLPPAAPRWLLHILIQEGLERLRLERFARVREFRGLHAELAKLIEEVSEPGECDGELSLLFTDVEARLTELGFALRNRRLRAAATSLRRGEVTLPAEVVFDGFFTLGPAEIEFVMALAATSSLMVTLPEPDARLEKVLEIERLTSTWRAPERVVFSAATPEREAEEIARRVLEQADGGRPLREMGVVLRSREPYQSLLETTLARFGVPARSYFLDTLGSHPAVAYLARVVRAALNGWDHADLNALLRMPVSGVGATAQGDRLDFALREALPGRGLPVARLKDQPAVLDQLQRRGGWRREKLEPADWAERLRALGGLVARPQFPDELDREEVAAWRSTASAVARFGEAVQQAAGPMGSGKIALEALWERVETALAAEVFASDDRRRNVVHIMDVYEARQWELPVVFVCGLVERVFPQYHGENPVLGDAARKRLGLPTSAELQAEEARLFNVAITRATEQVVLSYPRFDGRGEETLASFFLSGVSVKAAETSVRPKATRAVEPAAVGPIRIPSNKRLRLSATSIEDFLQCPFKFFARKTLKLRERPAAPRDRLNVLMQGTILHRALAEYWRAPLLGVGVLDQVFDSECARERVPRTHRTEAVRLELLRHFEAFLKNDQVDLGWKQRVEEEFEFELRDGLTIRGRIDRLELGTDGQALVIDYKYSAQVKGRVREAESGGSVQGGLYMLAAEKAFGLDPIGMLYCGLKRGVKWEGWHAPVAGLEQVGEAVTGERIRELMGGAEQRALETREGILAGRIEVHPADTKKCDWCDYRDICRRETLTQEIGTGAGQ